jgi:hypothetical protein
MNSKVLCNSGIIFSAMAAAKVLFMDKCTYIVVSEKQTFKTFAISSRLTPKLGYID